MSLAQLLRPIVLTPFILIALSGCYDAPNPLPTCTGWVDGNSNYPSDIVKECCDQDSSGYYGKLKASKRTDLAACMSCNPLFCTDLLVQERGLITNFNTADTSGSITSLASSGTSTPGRSEGAALGFGVAGGPGGLQAGGFGAGGAGTSDPGMARTEELVDTTMGVLSSVKEGESSQNPISSDIPVDPFTQVKNEIANDMGSGSGPSGSGSGPGMSKGLSGIGSDLKTQALNGAAATAGMTNFQIGNGSYASSGGGGRGVASTRTSVNGVSVPKGLGQGNTSVDFGSGSGGSSDGENIQINDPEDYFTRTDLSADIFKAIQKRYEKVQLSWVQAK